MSHKRATEQRGKVPQARSLVRTGWHLPIGGASSSVPSNSHVMTAPSFSHLSVLVSLCSGTSVHPSIWHPRPSENVSAYVLAELTNVTVRPLQTSMAFPALLSHRPSSAMPPTTRLPASSGSGGEPPAVADAALCPAVTAAGATASSVGGSSLTAGSAPASVSSVAAAFAGVVEAARAEPVAVRRSHDTHTTASAYPSTWPLVLAVLAALT